MNFRKNNKKNQLIFNILNNFDNVDKKLNDEHKNIFSMKRQILSGNRVLSNIKTLNNKNNMFKSFKNINEVTKNNVDKNLETEIKPVNRLNIHNYLEIYNTEVNKDDNYKNNNISEDKNDGRKIIKCFLDQLSEENKKREIENKLKLIELHDCNKRKKLKLKPINIKLPVLNNSLSQSNKSIFTRKIIYYNKNNKNQSKNNIINKEKIKNYLDNPNTSYYSTLFKNTTVNIIKLENGETKCENPYYSPSLNRNLWEEFQRIDNHENESYEKSLLIKEDINEMNNNKYKKPVYFSVKKDKKDKNEKNKNDDITKIRSIKDIEKILFKNKKSAIFKNINLKRNLKPIIPKGKIN